MRPLKLVAIVTVAAALSAGHLPTPSTPRSSAPRALAAQPASATCWNWRPKERGFADKHNAARRNAGVSKLYLDRHLGRVARKHTYEMIRNDRLYHTSSAQLSKRVTRWTMLGENVGVGGTVDSLFKAFMNSPSHRDNVLYGRFKYFGIGTVQKNDKLWVTIVFESSRDPGTTLRMPRC